MPCTCPCHSAHIHIQQTHAALRGTTPNRRGITPSVDVVHTLSRRSIKLPHDERPACKTHTNSISVFSTGRPMQLRTNRRPHAPAPSFVNLVKLCIKSSFTRTRAVVCEPGETAHKSSSTRTNAVVCEPGETAHKSSSTCTSAVVCEPCETAHKTSPKLPFAMVVWEPRASAHNTCWPGYLSSVRRDSACSGRLLLVTAFENIVPANMEQTKKGHVSYPVILTESLPPPPTLLLRYPHTPQRK